jgi:two-component system sensor histidine kinase TctE
VPTRAPFSLRRRLLAWLIVPLIGIGFIAVIDADRAARITADSVLDRVLSGSALAIADRVVVGSDGELEVDIPYVALDMLTSAAQDRVFYRVEGPSGRFLTGYKTLNVPQVSAPKGDRMAFADGKYRGADIRLAIYSGAASSGVQSIGYRVIVAETTNSRRQLARDILIRSAVRQALLIASAAIIVWFAVSRALKPLYRLQAAIGRRTPDDLRPIEHQVPREVRGLVDTINSFMDRLEGALDALRNFTGNASHQLRTPLAIIRTQMALTTRADTLDEARTAAAQADKAVVHGERVLAQLLVLARIDQAASDRLARSNADLAQIAQRATEAAVPGAARIGIDLGFDADGPVPCNGDEMLLGEMVANLIGNAVRYCGAGAQITVGARRQGETAVIEIDDNGPGIAAPRRAEVLKRFARPAGANHEGAGLGLAIAGEIAQLFGGRLELLDGRSGTGLLARVTLPAD